MRNYIIGLAGAVASGLALSSVASQDAGAKRDVPRELGAVHFERDYVKARAEAAKTGKPLFVLFDEVPGCANCTSFGDAVLSHALLVEAIETLFVPVAVYNNHDGADRAVLERFGEPAWNNPVLRFVDANEAQLAPRLADTYAVPPVARRLIAALEAAHRDVPGYLRLLAGEGEAFEPIYFAMGCFWSGEACLGAMEGVASTRPGFLEGGEVVEVQLAPGADANAVVASALEAGCATQAYVRSNRAVRGVTTTKDRFRFAEADDKHALQSGRLASVRLDEAQRTRVNAAVARGEDVKRWLSPRQVARFESRD